jgi:predicted nucleotidyltransferase
MKTQTISTDEILARLKSFKENGREEFGLVSLGIFGSFARGQANAQSDVDVVFESDTPNLFLTSRMKLDLEELLERPVDLVRLREKMNPRLKTRILREARHV